MQSVAVVDQHMCLQMHRFRESLVTQNMHAVVSESTCVSSDPMPERISYYIRYNHAAVHRCESTCAFSVPQI